MTQASSETNLPDTQAVREEGFGAALKREREAQGISLGDMSALSRLSVDQIRALEAEDVEKLPAPVYTRAFIRDVANQLSIDYTPLVADYVSRFAQDETGQIPSSDPSSEVVIGKRNEHRGFKFAGIALIAAVLAAGCWGVYSELLAPDSKHAVVSEVQTNPPASVLPQAKPDEVKTEAEVPAPDEKTLAGADQKTDNAVPSVEEHQEPAKPSETVTPPVGAEAPLQLEPAAKSPTQKLFLAVESDCWVHVRSIRGKNLIARTVKAGETIEMDIPRGSHFTIGNTAALRMKVDGEPYVFEDKSKRGIAKFILK